MTLFELLACMGAVVGAVLGVFVGAHYLGPLGVILGLVVAAPAGFFLSLYAQLALIRLASGRSKDSPEREP